MTYQVTVTDVAARPTAVVAATTTWQEFPALWQELLDEVWACLRAGGITRDYLVSWCCHDDDALPPERGLCIGAEEHAGCRRRASEFAVNIHPAKAE